jgi:hypothetical protein
MKSKTLMTFVIIMSAMASLGFQKKTITEAQAIAIAEDFIRCNGYTDKPIDTTKYKLQYELFEGRFELAKVLESRRNSLQPRAYCISQGNDDWDIGFLSTSVTLNALDSISKNSNLSGRAVHVDKLTGDARMEHKSPLFSKFRKL